MSFSEEIKKIFIKGSNLSRLIYVNLAVFVVVNLVYAILYLFNGPAEVLIEWLSLPADFNVLIRRPWTIITYMFLHKSFLHILFNLIVLYWFGKIFLKYLSQRQLLSIYLLGGLSGGLFYIAAYNIFPVFEIDKYFAIALGASASVMAILVAIAALVPKQEIYLMFFEDGLCIGHLSFVICHLLGVNWWIELKEAIANYPLPVTNYQITLRCNFTLVPP